MLLVMSEAGVKVRVSLGMSAAIVLIQQSMGQM